MREIKFRSWDAHNKRMHYEMNFRQEGQRDLNEFLGGYDALMQYTGLTDNNDEEVYEGDIISGYYSDEVFWDDDRGQWMVRNSENPNGTLWEVLQINKEEVIGNIYENPELLDEKE